MGEKTQAEKIMKIKYEYLAHSDMDSYYMEVCRAMAQAQYRPDVIIAPMRGGVDFGIKLSNWFDDVDVIALHWQTRDGAIRDTVALKEVLRKYRGGTVLIVDDICDTGKTLSEINTVVDRFSDLEGAVLVDYAVAIHNEECDFEPTWRGREIHRNEDTQWFVFPWENWWVSK